MNIPEILEIIKEYAEQIIDEIIGLEVELENEKNYNNGDRDRSNH